SPPAHPQWWHSHVPFSTFTDRQRACFFFRVGEHSGQITSTSPEACAGSSIRKSAQLLVIQPPLVLLVLSLPQSRPLDQRGALLPFRRGFPRPSLRRVERRLCRRGTDASRRESSRRDRRSLCEDLTQSKTACRPYVVRKSQYQYHAIAERLAERALSESLSERCPSRSRIALRWSFGRLTDACYGVRSPSLGVL